MDIRLHVVSTVVRVDAGPMKIVPARGRGFARMGSIFAFCAAAMLGYPQIASADSINLTVRRGNVMTDQANRISTGNLAVNEGAIPEQTITVGTAGTLTGVEFAPLRDSADAGDQILGDVSHGGIVLASASVDAGGFPPGGGVVPLPLDPITTGPGYVDLSALHIAVTAGEILSVTLRPGFPPGICDLKTNTCAQGRPSSVICFEDLDCDKEIRAGTSGNTYAGGILRINGQPSNMDLAFKLLLEAPNSGDAVTLT